MMHVQPSLLDPLVLNNHHSLSFRTGYFIVILIVQANYSRDCLTSDHDQSSAASFIIIIIIFSIVSDSENLHKHEK